MNEELKSSLMLEMESEKALAYKVNVRMWHIGKLPVMQPGILVAVEGRVGLPHNQ